MEATAAGAGYTPWPGLAFPALGFVVESAHGALATDEFHLAMVGLLQAFANSTPLRF